MSFSRAPPGTLLSSLARPTFFGGADSLLGVVLGRSESVAETFYPSLSLARALAVQSITLAQRFFESRLISCPTACK